MDDEEKCPQSENDSTSAGEGSKRKAVVGPDEEEREGARFESMSEKQLAREIKALEKKMLAHAKNLEFEEAARARDQLMELRKKVFGVELASE